MLIPKTILNKVLPGLAIAVIALALICAGRWWGTSVADARWLLKWSQRDKDDRDAKIEFTEGQRRIEAKRQGEIDAIQKKAETDMATARRNAAVARAESDRLQSGITAALAQLRAGGADTGTADVRSARDKTGLLLAELYREIDTAAGEYAEEADRAFDIGKRCEASYDAVRAKH